MTDTTEFVEHEKKRLLTLKEAAKLFSKTNPDARITIVTSNGEKTVYQNYSVLKDDFAYKDEFPRAVWSYTKHSHVKKIVPKRTKGKNSQLILKFYVD